MATTGGAWRCRLNSHPIFDVLSKQLDWLHEIKESKRYIAIDDGRLYLWNPHNETICTTNIKSLLDHETIPSYQTLLCSDPPLFRLEEIALNKTGTCLALIGRTGVSVLHLPQRWGKGGNLAGGKEKVMCKTQAVGERLFSCSQRMQLLQAAWHPGSPTGTHLLLLTSDNWLRLFDLLDANSAVQSIQLGDSPSSTISAFSALAALGHQAVAFDFGSPYLLVRKGCKPPPSADTAGHPLAWPVYLLWASGDVYLIHSSIGNLSPPLKPKLRGPLVMQPPAEDNYGTDACSLLYLGSHPPALVIGTPAGKLYHCVLLTREEDEETSRSFYEREMKIINFYSIPPEPTLYLYESVELELSLTTVAIETDEPVDDDFTCPIQLHSDPDTPFRYHCSHSAGVHSVVLPWSQRFQQFCNEALVMSSELPSLDQEAVVEHLICTKPHSASDACPILGVCVSGDRQLGTTLIAVTSDAECVTLPLMTPHIGEPPALQSSQSDKSMSPLRKLHKEPFDQHIKRILNKNTVNPLIKTSSNTDLSPQECFQLLSRATQVFREEYIQKQDLARQEIARRLCVLKEQKEFQQSELSEVKVVRNKLRERAEGLAEKYEEAQDLQEQIIYRIETILKKLQSRLPVMSEAERQMNKELRQLEDKLGPYKQAIKQLRTKRDYQVRQLASQHCSGPILSLAIDKNNSGHIQDLLKDQSQQISDLVTQVNSMKLQLNA